MIRAMDLPARRTEITVYRYQKERMRTAATTPASAARTPASAARTLLLLAAAVLFVVTGWAAAPVQAHPSSFSDVPDSGSVHQAVEYMAAAGMLSGYPDGTFGPNKQLNLSLIHISEPTRLRRISYAVFCLKKKKKKKTQ